MPSQPTAATHENILIEEMLHSFSMQTLESAQRLEKASKIIQMVSRYSDRWVLISVISSLLLVSGLVLGSAIGYYIGSSSINSAGTNKDLQEAKMHTESTPEGLMIVSDGNKDRGVKFGRRNIDGKFAVLISTGG